MKLLVDGNILLDVLQNREPHVTASALVWKLCETGQAKGVVSALTFANLVYVLRRELDPMKTEEVLRMLSLIFSFAELSGADLLKAACLHWNDYEDALQAAAADRIHADYLITRNEKDFSESNVPALSPKEFLGRFMRASGKT